MEHFLFFIGLSFLIAHEMDAMRCKEWRILPGFSLFSDTVGQNVFVFAHIPLFILVFYQLAFISDTGGFVKGFDIFMIVHIVFHLLFLRHKNNNFNGWISWILIIGAGIFGIADLIIN